MADEIGTAYLPTLVSDSKVLCLAKVMSKGSEVKSKKCSFDL